MRLLHVGLIVQDLNVARDFYCGLLGLNVDARPDLGFPGLFLALGNGQQIHLMQIHDPYIDCISPAHGGRDRHIALSVKSLPILQASLDAAGHTYTFSRSGRAAIFFRDPDGNTLECIAG